MNVYVEDPSEKLFLPSEKFNREMGAYKDEHWGIKGEPIKESDWESYLNSVMPNDETDKEFLAYTKEPDWITPAWKSSYDKD